MSTTPPPVSADPAAELEELRREHAALRHAAEAVVAAYERYAGPGWSSIEALGAVLAGRSP
jgi:hypothetical protein